MIPLLLTRETTQHKGIIMRYEREYSSVQNEQPKWFKDVINKKITGVCAGIARYYGCPTWVTRLVAIIALLMMPTVTLVAYIVASILLPNRAYIL